MDESKFFQNDMDYNPSYGVNFHIKFTVALDIIRHAALVSAKENGEDSSGRQKLMLLPAKDVATRALDIAGILVDGAVERGWVGEITVTPEQKNIYIGKMRRLQYTGELEKE